MVDGQAAVAKAGDKVKYDRGNGAYQCNFFDHFDSSFVIIIPAMEIGSVGAIIKMLLGGYGSSFLPEFAVAKHIKKGELALLDVKVIDIQMYSYYICSRDRWINPVMKEFIRIASDIAY